MRAGEFAGISLAVTDGGVEADDAVACGIEVITDLSSGAECFLSGVSRQSTHGLASLTDNHTHTESAIITEMHLYRFLGYSVFMTVTRPESIGRRERKKAATRAAISEAALRLFLENGFDHVNVKDIADAADVAVTTLFQHFPSKESLVFDQDEDREKALVAAVMNRPAEQSILDALLSYYQNSRALTLDPALKDFLDLVRSTPALRDYARRMWTRHEESLARAIAETTGLRTGSVKAAALARFSLDALNLASEYDNPSAALSETFALLRSGWTDSGAGASVS